MAAAANSASLRKPVFIKVDQLRPGTSGHTLAVKVVSSKLVLQKARPDGNQVRHVRIAECIVGDDTGVIVFTARNEQGIHFFIYSLFLLYSPVLLFTKLWRIAS
jgi:replication factor A1